MLFLACFMKCCLILCLCGNNLLRKWHNGGNKHQQKWFYEGFRSYLSLSFAFSFQVFSLPAKTKNALQKSRCPQNLWWEDLPFLCRHRHKALMMKCWLCCFSQPLLGALSLTPPMWYSVVTLKEDLINNTQHIVQGFWDGRVSLYTPAVQRSLPFLGQLSILQCISASYFKNHLSLQ